MTNQGVVNALMDLNINFHRAEVGDKYISRELVKNELNLEENHQAILSKENFQKAEMQI